MGPEIIAAVLGPLITGCVTMMIWTSKKNTESINRSISDMHYGVTQVERKVEDLGLEVAKKYVTADWMVRQMEAETRANEEISDRLDVLSTDLKKHIEDSNITNERFRGEMAEIKDMQWQMRLEQLEEDKKI